MCGWIGCRVWVLPSNSSEVLAPWSAYRVVFSSRHCWLAATLLQVCLVFGVCPSRIFLCQLDFCSREKNNNNAALTAALQLPTALIALCDMSFVNMKLPCTSGWTRRSSPSHLHQRYDSLFSHSCTHFRLLLYGVTRRTCGLFSFLYLYYCVCVRVWLVIGKCVAFFFFFCPQPCSLNFTQFTVQRLKHSCNIPMCACAVGFSRPFLPFLYPFPLCFTCSRCLLFCARESVVGGDWTQVCLGFRHCFIYGGFGRCLVKLPHK